MSVFYNKYIRQLDRYLSVKYVKKTLQISISDNCRCAFSALTLLVGRQEGHTSRYTMGHGSRGHMSVMGHVGHRSCGLQTTDWSSGSWVTVSRARQVHVVSAGSESR